MKTLVWFDGGGPLGSFGCGAWRGIAAALAERGDPVVAIGGSSIGGLNAACVVSRLGAPDHGADALERLWRHDIATPSWPFVGWAWGPSEPARRLRSWNGLLTGLLVGNGLYRPSLAGWTPWGAARRFQQPLFARDRMARLIRAHMPPYRSDGRDDVLLALATTDVHRGTLQLHDSDTTELGEAHLLASTALPGLFDPVEIDGVWHWDGDVVRDSPLPAFVQAVRRSRRATATEPLRLVTVELLPRPATRLPGSSPEVMFRALNLMQADRLHPPADPHLVHVRIVRPPSDEDPVSGLMDHSPERVDALIAEGQAAAAEALPAAHAVA